jgi:hypothetical protein
MTPVSRPRILMPTGRNFTRRAFLGGHYEAQDVLAAIDDVDLLCLEPGWRFQLRENWLRRLLFRDVSKRLIHLSPGLRKVRLTREYDLFLVRCQTYWDFLHISAIEGWKDYCKTSVCWIDEMWAAELPIHKYWLHALARFDHIFVGYAGSVKPISTAISRPCHWLPGGVDCLRFSPYPEPPPRVIDVYSIGRRSEGIHQVLLRAAGSHEFLYLYDTFPKIAERDVFDHQQHRDLYANLAKRSRNFMVAPGKVDVADETQGQVEVGYRFYEGAAAGAVMIGQAPQCDAFGELFPWPDAVIEVQPDGSDIEEVLRRLRSDKGRLLEISRRNAAEALLRHDWSYRWKEILQVAGLDPSPRLAAREKRLKELAVLAANDRLRQDRIGRHSGEVPRFGSWRAPLEKSLQKEW